MKKIKDSIIVIGEAITEYYYFNSLKDTYRQLNIRPTYPKHSTGLDYLEQEIDKAISCLHYATPLNPWKRKKKRKGITPILKWQGYLRRWGLEQNK